MYTLEWTPHFTKAAKQFTRQHPNQKRKADQILRDLALNPFKSSLKLHPLSGKLKGVHAIRLTYSCQITLTLKLSEKVIILLDIGSHDEVYS